MNNVPRSICILRLSALGDVTHVIPVVRALQDAWPETQLTWVCGSIEHKLLSVLDGIEFVVFDKSSKIGAYNELFHKMRGRRFDVLLHMHASLRANIVSRFIKTQRRIGWDRARSRDCHHWFINESVAATAQQHQVEGFLSFLTVLGLPEVQPRWDIPITANERVLVEKHVDTSRRLLVISASSSHSLRNWVPQRYAEIADYAIRDCGMQVILVGAPSDTERLMSSEILHHMQTVALDLTGKDTLPQLCAMLGAADVVISPDSGPVHIANAMGTPVIGLYACTWSLRSGPYNSLGLCVDHYRDAAEQFLGQQPEHLRWGKKIEQESVMNLITVEEVKQKLDELLASTTD